MRHEKFKVPVTMARDNKQTAIALTTIHRHDKIFGAGECVVTIGNVPIEAIAVYAAKGAKSERYITTAEAARDWLVARGLNAATALVLINAGRGDVEARRVLHEVNAQNI